MRLTLRTLLAHMDGLLGPEDDQDIRKKLEESKFATDLYHKIRDVMRRIRLAAPSLSERNAAMDANVVAEYLDNVLPADRVAEFEETCLKSDIYLAEVASSHQILTLVLGEPAEIDPASRERMYVLPQLPTPAEEERAAAAEAAVTIASGDGQGTKQPDREDDALKSRPKSLVPDYLREPPKQRRRLLPIAAVLLLAGSLVGLVLAVTGQFEPGAPLGDFGQWIRFRVESSDSAEIRKLRAELEEIKKKEAEKNLPSPSKPDSASPAAPEGPGKASEAGAKPDEGVVAEKPATESAPPAGANADLAKPATPEPKDKPAAVPAAAEGTEKPPVEVARADAKLPPKPAPADDSSPLATASPKPAGSADAAGGPAKPKDGDAGTSIGRLRSEAKDVLLRFDETAPWHRVLPEGAIGARQPLLAMPTFRPRIVITKIDATLELPGGTQAALLGDDAQGLQGVEIAFGRLVVKPLTVPGVRLRLVADGHSGVVTLLNVESTVGLEATRHHEPGTDPEAVPSRAAVTLYVAKGGALWDEGGGKPVARLMAPARLVIEPPPGGDAGGGSAREVPGWVLADSLDSLESRASALLSQSLQSERATGLVLREAANDPRIEVRRLAARCQGYLGQFDSLLATLNSATNKLDWPDYVEDLRQAVARGPETAAALRVAMEKQYGADGPAMFRMLWGYTDRDLQNGQDARLVKALDHEVMAMRVLAFWNLNDITGMALRYSPAVKESKKRQVEIKRWNEWLEGGKIRFKTPEEKHPSADAAAAPDPDEVKTGKARRIPPAPRPEGEDVAPDPPAPGVKP